MNDSCSMIANNSYSGIAIRVCDLLYSESMAMPYSESMVVMLYSESVVVMLYSESVLDLYSENGRHGENMLYSKSEIFAFSEDCKTWLCFESGGLSPDSCFENGGVSPNFWSDEISSSSSSIVTV